MFRNLSTHDLAISGRQSEVIELALSYGFRGIDLDLAEFQQTVKQHGLPHARRLIDSARLKLGTFQLPLNFDEDDDAYRAQVAGLSEVLSLANQIGATRAVATIAPANDARPYHENFELHRRRLNEFSDVLAPYGIRLGLTFSAQAAARKDRAFQFIHAYDALAMLVGMLKGSHVGLALDLWQMYSSGAGLEELRKLPVERIVCVYLSDAPADVAPGDLTADQRMLPGESGAIDSAAVLAALASAGYDGPITPRVDRAALAGMRREQIVKLAGERIDQAWKAAGLSTSGKLAPARS